MRISSSQTFLLHCIVFDETIKMVACSCWLLGYAAAFFVQEVPLHLYTGEYFCRLVNFISVVGLVQSFSGGVGIALMRLLFIRFPSKVRLGQLSTSLVISIATLVTTVGIRCNGHYFLFDVDILLVRSELKFSSPLFRRHMTYIDFFSFVKFVDFLLA